MAISKPLNGSSSLSRRSSSRAAADIRALCAPLAALLGLAFFLAFVQAPLLAQVDARMLQYPDVSATHIAFEYAGDIWIVPKAGGLAHRVTSARGMESLPRFSPDGSTIAFNGNYDGNYDIYTVPALGGLARRVTHHGMPDRMTDWFPGGKELLFTSAMESGKQRFSQFYSVPREGGLPAKLPVPYGEFGSLSPDGKKLAYTPISRVGRTWKRYRGGMAPDIWVFDLEALTAENITQSDANEEFPMWHGGTIYFLSDRGPSQRYNIWAYDIATKAARQVTQIEDYDVHFPEAGPSDIVFEAGGKLYLFDFAGGQTREVKVEVTTDEATLMPRMENVEKMIQNAWPSPDGKRAVFEARGDLFSVPAENGNVVNLTRSSGVAERYPAWSPDGRSVAYWSDRPGEYELFVRDLAAGSEGKPLTSCGPGYRYQPRWSPDGKKLAFIDKAMDIQIFDLAGNRTVKVDKGKFMYQSELEQFSVSWSPDSRWLAYARDLDNRTAAVFIHDTREGKTRQVTSGFYTDTQPSFDPGGQYLYFLTNRTFRPLYGDQDATFTYANATTVAAVPLRTDVPSPLAPKNDTVEAKKAGEEKAAPKPGEKPGEKTDKEKEGKEEKEKRESRGGAERGPDRFRRLRGPPGHAPPRGGELQQPPGRDREGRLPPAAEHGVREQAEAGEVLRPREAGGEDRRRRRRRLPAVGRRQKDARGQVRFVLRGRRRRRSEARKENAHRPARGDRRAARGMAADLQRRLAVRARFLLRPEPPRRRLERAEGALREAHRRGRDTGGCQLRARRDDRRAQRFAHLPGRRPGRVRAQPAGRLSRR